MKAQGPMPQIPKNLPDGRVATGNSENNKYFMPGRRGRCVVSWSAIRKLISHFGIAAESWRRPAEHCEQGPCAGFSQDILKAIES